ncbi:MAG: redoxin family protein [Verrucomicrobiales bacterium]|nr:redoxin family protein [Verrucomicrobiales bacterium]
MRMLIPSFPTLILLTLMAAAPVVAADPVLLTDLEGKAVNPLDAGDKKAVVLFFVSPYCPTSNTFAPAMKEISEAFSEDFAFFSIHSDTSVSDQDRAVHAGMMEITHPVLKDGEQKLAKQLGAAITPEAIVIDPDGKTLYQGRINDLYLGPTQKQKEVTTHDLKNALTAILNGEPVPVPKTEAIGCTISGI